MNTAQTRTVRPGSIAGKRQRTGWMTPKLVRVLASAACWGFAYSSYFMLPTYLEHRFGAGPDAIGVIVGIFGVAILLFTPSAGRAVDRHRRKSCIAVGSAIMAATSLGYLFVDGIGPLLVGLRIAQGLSYALVLVSVGTLVADSVPADKLSQALGLSGASMLVMNALGPGVAEPLSSAAGWPAVFGLSAFAAALSAVLALSVDEERPARTDDDLEAQSLLAVLRKPIGSHYAFMMTLTGAVFGSVMTFEQPYARELGRLYVGGFYVAFAAGALFMRIVFGSLPDRFGRHRVGWISCLVYAIAVGLLCVTDAAWIEAIGLLFGLSHGLLYPSINAIAVTGVEPNERGRVMAIFTGAFNLGVWAGATLLGLFATEIGYRSVFAITAGVAVAGTLYFRASVPLGAGERSPRPIRSAATG